MQELITHIRVESPTAFKDLDPYQEGIKQELSAFKEAYGVSNIVGILGGAENIPESQAAVILHQFLGNFSGKGIAILTGGTSDGIPAMGHVISKEYNIPTIGVYPPNATKWGLSNNMDLGIMTQRPSIGNPSFGSESYSLVSCLNAGLVIGGSYGTYTEVGIILKRNKSKIKDGEKPIFLCPIQGTGGAADCVRTMAGMDVAASLPPYPVYDGNAAASFLQETLLYSQSNGNKREP